MKTKVLTLVCLIALFAMTTNAQSTQTVNLSITLSDVASLTVTTATPLSFPFNTEAAYTNGVAITEDNHLNVLSSRNYVVSVNAGTITGPHTLAANTVSLQASTATLSGVYTGIASYPTVTLSATPAALVTSSASSYGTGANSRTYFKVAYTVGGSGAYLGKTGSATPDVIPVVYTLTQP